MKTLLTAAVIVMLVSPAIANASEDCDRCTYQEPCTVKEMNGCNVNIYDVFCVKNRGKEIWLTGNNRGGILPKCSAEIPNPFKKKGGEPDAEKGQGRQNERQGQGNL